MKYVVLIVTVLVAVIGVGAVLVNQGEQREADKKWSEFTHKEDRCNAAKQRTMDMKRQWLKKGVRPTADDVARWKDQESQACAQ